jgi:hypothetical protein
MGLPPRNECLPNRDKSPAFWNDIDGVTVATTKNTTHVMEVRLAMVVRKNAVENGMQQKKTDGKIRKRVDVEKELPPIDAVAHNLKLRVAKREEL